MLSNARWRNGCAIMGNLRMPQSPKLPRKLPEVVQTLSRWSAGSEPTVHEVKSFLVDVRMCLEATGQGKLYPTLQFYCDLLVHETLSYTKNQKILVHFSNIGLFVDYNENHLIELKKGIELQYIVRDILVFLFNNFNLKINPFSIRKIWDIFFDAVCANLNGSVVSIEDKLIPDGRLDKKFARSVFGDKEREWLPYKCNFYIVQDIDSSSWLFCDFWVKFLNKNTHNVFQYARLHRFSCNGISFSHGENARVFPLR